MKPPTTIAELRKALPGMWFSYGPEDHILNRRQIYFGVKGNPHGCRTVTLRDEDYKDNFPSRAEIVAAAYAAARAFEKGK